MHTKPVPADGSFNDHEARRRIVRGSLEPAVGDVEDFHDGAGFAGGFAFIVQEGGRFEALRSQA